MYYYREIYGLNGTMDALEKEFVDAEGVEVYPLKPYDMGFMVLKAPSEEKARQVDEECIGKIISFCERNDIESHLLGPLEPF